MPSIDQELARAAEGGDPADSDQLFAALYHELHRLAQRSLRRDGGAVTISTTTLLHEAYLNVANRDGLRFPDSGRFLAYAARAMRGLIISATRRRHALKRGAGFVITQLETTHAEEIPDEQELTRLHEALEQLAAIDPALAELVDLKYFCGISLVEISALRGVSVRTVYRDWEKARLLLNRSLDEGGAS